jgi:hypothetical protein
MSGWCGLCAVAAMIAAVWWADVLNPPRKRPEWASYPEYRL